MRSEKLSKRFWALFGTFNFAVIFYLFAYVDPPETDDARVLAAVMLATAILALGVVDVIAVTVATSYAGTKQRSMRHA